MSTAVASSAGAAPPVPAASGLDLTRLRALDDPKLSPGQKAALTLRLFRDEMVHPTPRPGPPFTQVKTHDYVLAQIARRGAASLADGKILRKQWESLQPGEVKDSLLLLLTLRGPAKGEAEIPGTAEAVSGYVSDAHHPMRLRELAATALGRLACRTGDAHAGEVLAKVIREDTQVQYLAGAGKAQSAAGGPLPGAAVGSVGFVRPVAAGPTVPPSTASGHAPESPTKGLRTTFPVRVAAAAAIRSMEKAGLLLSSFVTHAAERVEAAEPPAPAPAPPAKLRASTEQHNKSNGTHRAYKAR